MCFKNTNLKLQQIFRVWSVHCCCGIFLSSESILLRHWSIDWHYNIYKLFAIEQALHLSFTFLLFSLSQCVVVRIQCQDVLNHWRSDAEKVRFEETLEAETACSFRFKDFLDCFKSFRL